MVSLLMNSLRARLLLSVSAVLIISLTLMGYGFDKIYQYSSKIAEEARLQGYIHDILRITDPSALTSVDILSSQTNRRLLSADSGLYATVLSNETGSSIWLSPSMRDQEFSSIEPLSMYAPKEFNLMVGDAGDSYWLLRESVAMLDAFGTERGYTFIVLESRSDYLERLSDFRANLMLWLALSYFVVLILLAFVLHWGFYPLRQVAKDLQLMEHGEKENLDDEYPNELQGLTGNINALVKHERDMLLRSRNAMADLAHSFKTPLAVLGSTADGLNSYEHLEKKQLTVIRENVTEQIQRLDSIVRYQLQRAGTMGRSQFSKPIEVKPILNKLLNALNKAFLDKQMSVNLVIDSDCLFYGDEGDLTELCGNLFENAYKYGESYVDVNVVANGRELTIIVKNDGEVIKKSDFERLLKRGERADTQQPGQGIGLSVIDDICQAYDGDISLLTSLEHNQVVEIKVVLSA